MLASYHGRRQACAFRCGTPSVHEMRVHTAAHVCVKRCLKQCLIGPGLRRWRASEARTISSRVAVACSTQSEASEAPFFTITTPLYYVNAGRWTSGMQAMTG